jgi:hypothetical protein
VVLRLDRIEPNGRHSRWICQCDCGREKSIRANALRTGDTRSCGCLVASNAREELKQRINTQTKTCALCKEIKAFSEFSRTTAIKSKDGLRSRCKRCDTAAYRQKKYGISRETFAAMLAAQDYSCASCGAPVDESSALDHCHASGQVRGILSNICNTTLGQFGESARRLTGLLMYLKKTRQLQLFPTGHGPTIGEACPTT